MSLIDDLDEMQWKYWEAGKRGYKGHSKAYKGNSRVEKIQIVQDSSGSRITVHEDIDQLNYDQLASWLEAGDDPAPLDVDNTTLKLMLISTPNPKKPNPLSEEERTAHAEAVTKAFRTGRLPFGGLVALSGGRTFAKAPTKLNRQDGTSSQISRYYYTSDRLNMTWAICHSTRTVRAAMLCEDGTYYRDEFVACLPTLQNFIDQPMLLGLISAKLAMEQYMLLAGHNSVDLYRIRKKIGMFTWDSGTSDVRDVDSTGLDYGIISKNLSAIHGSTNQNRVDFHVLLRFMELLLQELRHCDQIVVSNNRSDVLNKAEELAQALEIIKEHTETVLLKLERYIDDMTNMMSAIYNLIAQKDSLVGLDLAKMAQKDSLVGIQLAEDSRTLAIESKRDSSSMKTIAAVTMAFLPGTFVASFFAIPMFDWNRPAGHNVNTQTFWIYWTVTIPLTISTFVIWAAWFQYKTARDEREDTVERAKLQDPQAAKERYEGFVQSRQSEQGGDTRVGNAGAGNGPAGPWSRLMDRRHGLRWRHRKESGTAPQV